jgi:GPH family glycoside/pentoside/hexuronide:cation symporter
MGWVIERTRSRQGKIRPWILVAAPLMTLATILLFAVPHMSILAQAVWVTISYSFYYAIAYTIYNISNILMVPLSTRKTKQRDTLALVNSVGIQMVSGLFASMIIPMFILPYVGVSQSRWLTIMAIFGCLAIPAVLLQYYFTRERISEEGVKVDAYGHVDVKEEPVVLSRQIHGCLKSKFWVLVMVIIFISTFQNYLQLTSLVYFFNWVLGTYNDGKTMTLMNVIGQAPLGFGVFIIWPLVKKMGKRNLILSAVTLTIVGNIIAFLNPHSMTMVLTGLVIRSFGNLPLAYLTSAMMADSLDHVEYVNGYRCDGFSSSVNSIIMTVCMGFATGVFNLFLSKLGYVPPVATGTQVVQNAAVQQFFDWGLFGVPAVCNVLIVIVLVFYTVEKMLPQIHAELEKRHGTAASQGVSK